MEPHTFCDFSIPLDSDLDDEFLPNLTVLDWEETCTPNSSCSSDFCDSSSSDSELECQSAENELSLFSGQLNGFLTLPSIGTPKETLQKQNTSCSRCHQKTTSVLSSSNWVCDDCEYTKHSLPDPLGPLAGVVKLEHKPDFKLEFSPKPKSEFHSQPQPQCITSHVFVQELDLKDLQYSIIEPHYEPPQKSSPSEPPQFKPPQLEPPPPQFEPPQFVPPRSQSPRHARPTSCLTTPNPQHASPPPVPTKRTTRHPSTLECSTCGRCFTRKGHLKDHVRIHSGARPYECVTCGRRFSQKSHLNRHAKIHSNDKKHSCDTCGKRFIQKSNLRQHALTHQRNGVPRPFPCLYPSCAA